MLPLKGLFYTTSGTWMYFVHAPGTITVSIFDFVNTLAWHYQYDGLHNNPKVANVYKRETDAKFRYTITMSILYSSTR